MIKMRIMRFVLIAGVTLYGSWLVTGCGDNTDSPMTHEADCDAAMLYELVDAELASVSVEDVDTVYDEHLLSDPWSGDRAECESTAPDSTWRESPWIKTRALCVTRTCGTWPVEWVVTNFRTGFGALKDGAMTLETLQVQNVSETAQGWDVLVACGANDNTTSLRIPMRVYFDLDTECLDGINVVTSGYIALDQLLILIRIMDGEVSVAGADINDLNVHVEPFGLPTADGLLSDFISGTAAWMEGDSEEFFGLMAKERVEAAYDDFVAECP